MEAFEIVIVFGTVICKANIVDKGNYLYQITMSDSSVGNLKKNNGSWEMDGNITSIINNSDVDIIIEEIEQQYFNSLCNVTRYCSQCSPFKYLWDIDLFNIAINLEPGHSENFICTGCNNRSVYKDEKGYLYLAKQHGTEFKLLPINIDEIIK